MRSLGHGSKRGPGRVQGGSKTESKKRLAVRLTVELPARRAGCNGGLGVIRTGVLFADSKTSQLCLSDSGSGFGDECFSSSSSLFVLHTMVLPESIVWHLPVWQLWLLCGYAFYSPCVWPRSFSYQLGSPTFGHRSS